MGECLAGEVVERIEQLVAAKFARYRLPGLALGVIRDQELALFRGFGCADLDSGRKPDENSIARVASVTKTFTTTALVQLRDAGKLGLDDPLVRHVPEFAAAKVRHAALDDVTLRRLLTHRSGLVTESPAHGWAELRFPTREEVLGKLPETEVVIPQDSAFKYSNLAFALLGEVVQRAGGMPYTQYVQENLLDPLGMHSTCFDLTGPLRSDTFVGYNPTPYQDRPQRAPYAHLGGLRAAGQLHSSVADLARWVSLQFRTGAQQRGGEQVLSGRSLEEIQRPQYVAADWSEGQCLGWRATRVGNHVYHQHGGGIHGFGTQVWFNVPSKTGVVLLINMWPPHGGQELAREVLELILCADEAASKAISIPVLEPAPAELERFLGSYRAEPGIGVNIEYRDGKLRLTGAAGCADELHSPAQLEPTGRPDVWLVQGGRAAGEKAVFRCDAEGRVSGYRLGAFEFRKQ